MNYHVMFCVYFWQACLPSFSFALFLSSHNCKAWPCRVKHSWGKHKHLLRVTESSACIEIWELTFLLSSDPFHFDHHNHNVAVIESISSSPSIAKYWFFYSKRGNSLLPPLPMVWFYSSSCTIVLISFKQLASSSCCSAASSATSDALPW
jgi:hypothetical protein